MIKEVCARLKTLNVNDTLMFWPSLEAIIFSAIPIARFYPKVTPDLTTLISTYQELSPTHIAVRRAYLRLFKALMSM